jgi:hypothetical protein
MDRHARLPLASLVAALAVALLTGAATVAAAVRDDNGRRAQAEPEPPAPRVGTIGVLREWDRQRARAYAMGNEEALAALYVAGSRTGAADRTMLRAYRERGLRVTGMHTRVLEARVLEATGARICLVVTDVLLDAVAVADGREGGWALPRDGPSTRRVVLVRDGGWRVAEAYPATSRTSEERCSTGRRPAAR